MSAGQFKVGDVCVLQNFINDTYLNGMECVIVEHEGFDSRLIADIGPVSGNWFFVRVAGGLSGSCRSINLRRKDPPKPAREIDTVVSWSDCAWSPKREPA